jgi:hypothetical protein
MIFFIPTSIITISKPSRNGPPTGERDGDWKNISFWVGIRYWNDSCVSGKVEENGALVER